MELDEVDDNVQYASGSIEIEEEMAGPIPTMETLPEKKLDPSLMKALKLFAKNHKQLEKAHDPNKGQHRRVLS